mgnify:CR=1 FL=1
MATNLVSGYFRKAFQDFSGGLNDYLSPLVVGQNQFTELTNARINDLGILEKAKGYSVDGSPFPDDVDSFIRMMVNYKRGTTVDKLVVAALDEGNSNVTYKVDLKETAGDGVYSYIGHTAGTSAGFTNANTAVTGVATTWLSHLKVGDKIKATGHADSAYTEIATVNSNTSLTLVTGGYIGATATAVAYIARKIMNKDFLPSAIVFNNNLIISNGSDVMMTYNNTTLNDITDADAPRVKFLAGHKSRVFGLSTSGGPSSLFWSAVNDETSWDAAAVEPVFANDGGNACGFESFADSIVILKDNGNIYQVIGSFDQDVVGEPDYIRKLDTPVNMGSIAGFSSAVNEDNKLYFLAQTGVYSIDARMFITKESWNVETTTRDVVLTSGATSAKSFLFDTKTQWDTGAFGSPATTRSTTDGLIKRISDTITITDAKKASNLCAIKMASNGDVHYAYVASDGVTIKHVANTIGLVSTSYTTVVASAAILDLSLTLNASGDVAIAYVIGDGYVRVVEKLSAGSWGSPTSLAGNTGGDIQTCCSIRYGISVTTDLYAVGTGAQSGNFVYVSRRIAGTWTTRTVGTTSGGGVSVLAISNGAKLDIGLKSESSTSGVAIAVIAGTTTLNVYTIDGTNIGYDTITATYTAAITASNNYRCNFLVNSGTERIVAWSDGTTIKSRNIDASVSATVDASYGNHTGIYMNTSNQYSYMRFDSAGTETLVYNNTTTVVNATTAVYDVSGLFPGNRGFDSNGSVYCSIYFGANANEIIVRRIAPVGVWTGPEQSDSTLSAYGTYDVVGQVTNGDTILHEVALNSVSPATAYATITSGSVIGTDATKVYSRARVTFTATTFATPEVASVTMNYTGAGVGALFPYGTVFNNEYYLSYGIPADTGNSKVLVFDRGRAWLKVAYPVIFMARYRNALYGGSSVSGKVFKLLQNYRFDASAYTLTATSKEDLLGSMEMEKEVYKVYVIYKIQSSGTFDFSYRVNNFATNGGGVWVTQTVDQTKDGLVEIPGISGIMKSIQFKVESDDLDAQLGVVGWVVLYSYVNLR